MPAGSALDEEERPAGPPRLCATLRARVRERRRHNTVPVKRRWLSRFLGGPRSREEPRRYADDGIEQGDRGGEWGKIEEEGERRVESLRSDVATLPTNEFSTGPPVPLQRPAPPSLLPEDEKPGVQKISTNSRSVFFLIKIF